ncbi:hypothetical protein KXD97_26150 [Mycobacterium sp. SMC-8]|uniref:hypothetical protein n=1 Tax=Mycobacterium sp. SMC-8 TaxID=2857060 RepID=UPI0021B35D31|nr:hypothetical protein [Mycobacterium sp. SMC-8]UXA11461.1 hypothetical protein KXD97_26150 [Mycobacterium sp. SMC-8]
MDRAEEFTFAWALLDHAAAFLDKPTRVQLCIRVGAGELREAIIELLQHFTISDNALPPVLAASLWSWMNGFVGSDSETSLRDLASRIRVSTVVRTPAVEIPLPPLVPRRSERATRRLTLSR